MSVQQENNGNWMGDPSKTPANHGSGRTPPKDSGASFKPGISKLPPVKGSDSFPSRGKIGTGKREIL